MIIDSHTHIFSEETYRTYKEKSLSRVDKMLTLHFWVDLNDGGMIKRSIQDLLAFAEGKEDLAVVASVNIAYDIAEQIKNLEPLVQSGKVVGIKMYPGYQPFYPTDERVFPVVELCQKYEIPLIFHSGDVYDRVGNAELKYAHPMAIDSLAVRFPVCKIIIAHFGFPYFMETANIVYKNTNVFTEISGTIGDPASPEESTKLVAQYAQDLKRAFAYFPEMKGKVMFGTDYGGEHTSLNQVSPYIALIEELFSEEERDRAFSGLAEELFFTKKNVGL